MRRMLVLSFLFLFTTLSVGQAAIIEDFDGGGRTAYTLFSRSGSPGSIVDGGPTGSFVRITNLNGSNFNNIAFDEDPAQTGPAPDGLTIGFNFRMTDDAANNDAGGCCNSAADGLGFGLFDTGTYGDSGSANPGGANWENPRFADAFTVGFDVFQNIDVVNVNWGGSEIAQVDVEPFLNLNSGVFHRAVITLTPDGANTVFDMIIREDVLGTDVEHEIYFGQVISGMNLSELFNYRVIAGGRTGGAFLDGDFDNISVPNEPVAPFLLNGGGGTYSQDFDEMGTGRGMPKGWSGVTEDGSSRRVAGLGLTDGFLTVPGNDADGVLGIVNVGGNADSFGPAPDGFIPTWTAELGGDNNLFGRDDVIADGAIDRALGVSRENNDDAGELNFEIEIAEGNLRAFVLDWDLEIWGGDPDGTFRSPEGPGMTVDVKVGGTSYDTMTENLLPGALFDSIEDGSGSDHNPTLIDGNVYSVRGMTSGIKEVSGADGAIGNMVQINFNSNWNGATDDDANGWMPAIDNVRLRALAPGDADANGVVDVADLLQLLGGQKFNQGVDGVTWEQGDFNADDQFNTGDLLAMLSFLSGTFPSDPYASEAGGASDAVADIIVNSETGEVTVDLAGHTVSAIIIESASEIFNGAQPAWDTTSQFPSTLPGELGNVLFTSTAAGVDELGVVISAEFLGRDKEFYLQDLDLNILIASEGGALTKGNVIVVPEPSTWMLLGLGSLLLVGWRARSNATQSRQGVTYGVSSTG